jgi:hypothetical protein
MALHSVRNIRQGLVALAMTLPILYVLFAGVAIVQDRRSKRSDPNICSSKT